MFPDTDNLFRQVSNVKLIDELTLIFFYFLPYYSTEMRDSTSLNRSNYFDSVFMAGKTVNGQRENQMFVQILLEMYYPTFTKTLRISL